MAIVARATPRRLRPAATVLVGLSLLVATCSPGPTTAPTGPAASGTQAATATREPACEGPSIVPAATQPPWADRTWYEVFVRSFADSNGDGIGDLAGLTSKLDYLNDGNPATTADLGITGIWLMPIASSPSYHGYDVTDYMAVEPDYGDRAAMKAFLDAAHQRGIEVIVDLVINHTSSQHPWFKDALKGGPHHDWYIWSDTDPHWPSVAGGNPWHLASNGKYFYGAFWEGMPDLNLRNPEVTAEIDRIADFWLDDVGVDGFRIDAAKHLIEDDGPHQINTPETLAWLAGFNQHVHASHPDALVVGEVWDIGPIAGRYVPDSLDMTFNFDLADAVGTALRVDDASPLDSALSQSLTSWPSSRFGSFLTNHDQERIMSELAGDVAAAKVAAFTLLTEPGEPFVYYGEELGMTGRKPDERLRAPMQWAPDGPAAGFSSSDPWEALADGWQIANAATETADQGSLLSTYRGLISLRASHDVLANGATLVVKSTAHSVLGWLRTSADETLLAVVNVGNQPVADYSLSLASGPLCGRLSATIVTAVGMDPSVALVPPTTNAGGGFDAYQPISALAPRSGYLLGLAATQ
jgi:alpha-amylase